MRILHINKFLYRRGGAESYLLDLAELQRAEGHEVEFFGMRHPDNEPQRFEDLFPAEVEFEPVPHSATGRAMAFGRMLYSPAAWRGVRSVIERFRPDIVHAHNVYHQLSPSVLAPAARAGIPLVMTLHDYKLACPTHSFMRDGEVCEACVPRRFDQAVRLRCHQGSLGASAAAAFELSAHTFLGAYRPVRLFLCPSQFMLDKMTEARVFPERLRRIDNFVDATRLRPKQEPGHGALYVGRLSHEKGVDVLVRATAALPDGEVVDIVGDGPLRGELEALAASVAPGRVRFHGRVSSAEAVARMAAARVLALPTRVYENQPMALLEAFAVGTPAVVTAHGGAPEVASDPATATLVPPNDPAALAGALAAFLTDPHRAQAAIGACRERVERAHTAPIHMARLEALYAEAAGRGQNG